jgi:mannose-1-phosphate guanylyltransferase/mannose-6-phosphate isomerase
MQRAPRLHAVILAGGAGERFWPASRAAHPKPFLRVVDGVSLIAATVARAKRFADRGCVWIVCGAEHASAIRRETGLPAARVLVEPMRRNTAMAVGFAAAHIAAREPDAVLAMLPADHRIPDARAFARAIRSGAAAARDAGALVTLGVVPTRPDTGLGYIQRGAAFGGSHRGLHRVRRFVEKPPLARAKRFLASGDFLWNAGIFVWSARVILEQIAECEPELARALAPLQYAGRRVSPRLLDRAYRAAPSLPIDTAVLERSQRVWTLPIDFRWSDVGTWASLAEELGVAKGRSKAVAGDLACDATGGNLVWADGKVVALLGVEGLAVIDTPDALLVARLDRAAELRDIVRQLKASGRSVVT